MSLHTFDEKHNCQWCVQNRHSQGWGTYKYKCKWGNLLEGNQPPWVVDFIYLKGKLLYCVSLLLRETKLIWELPSSLTTITTYKSISASSFLSMRIYTKDHGFLWPLRNPQSLKHLASSVTRWPPRWPFCLLPVPLNLTMASYCRACSQNNLHMTKYKMERYVPWLRAWPNLSQPWTGTWAISSQFCPYWGILEPRKGNSWYLCWKWGGGGEDRQVL